MSKKRRKKNPPKIQGISRIQQIRGSVITSIQSTNQNTSIIKCTSYGIVALWQYNQQHLRKCL